MSSFLGETIHRQVPSVKRKSFSPWKCRHLQECRSRRSFPHGQHWMYLLRMLKARSEATLLRLPERRIPTTVARLRTHDECKETFPSSLH